MMHDGIGMVAEAIGAYTINVPGRGVQPRQGKLLAETFRRRAGDAQALILNRTTSTSRVPSSSVRRSTHNCLNAPSHFAVPSAKWDACSEKWDGTLARLADGRPSVE